MLFRVKTTGYGSYKQYHHVPVGTILHPCNIVDEFKCGDYPTLEVKVQWFQIVPMACLERIPHNKENLRKHKKQHRGW